MCARVARVSCSAKAMSNATLCSGLMVADCSKEHESPKYIYLIPQPTTLKVCQNYIKPAKKTKLTEKPRCSKQRISSSAEPRFDGG